MSRQRFSLPTLAFSALLMATPAMAQISARNFELKTAGELAVLCNTPISDPAYAEAMGYCRGYARGALAYHQAATPAGSPRLFCPPATIPPDSTLRTQFATWINASRQNAAMAPVEGMFRFLSITFPCPR